MAESITSFSSDADKCFNRRNVPHTWDVKLFFETPSTCEQHPDFLQALPLLQATLSKNKLNRFFLLRNVKKFAVCYKIENTFSLNVFPLMGVLEAETEVSYVFYLLISDTVLGESSIIKVQANLACFKTLGVQH